MYDNSSDSPRSPSSPDHETSSKRARLDRSTCSSSSTPNNDSVLGNGWELSRMERELTILRTKLSQTEAIATQNYNLRKQSEELFEKERNMLQIQAQVDKDTIELLQKDLEASIKSVLEARRAQAATETELSKLKSHTTETVQEEVVRQRKLFEEKLATMQEKLGQVDTLRQQVMRLEEHRRELTSKVQKYESIKLEVTPEVLKDEYHHLIQENGDVKAELKVFRKERAQLLEILAGKEQKTTNMVSNVRTSSSHQHQSALGPNDNDESVSLSDSSQGDEAVDGDDPDFQVRGKAGREQGKKDLRMKLGNNWILVSDRKYFNIDWKTEYQLLGEQGSRNYRCKKCPKRFVNVTEMKDHIFCQHYGGKFKCAHCINPHHSFVWRNNIRHHIRLIHSSIS